MSDAPRDAQTPPPDPWLLVHENNFRSGDVAIARDGSRLLIVDPVKRLVRPLPAQGSDPALGPEPCAHELPHYERLRKAPLCGPPAADDLCGPHLHSEAS